MIKISNIQNYAHYALIKYAHINPKSEFIWNLSYLAEFSSKYFHWHREHLLLGPVLIIWIYLLTFTNKKVYQKLCSAEYSEKHTQSSKDRYVKKKRTRFLPSRMPRFISPYNCQYG